MVYLKYDLQDSSEFNLHTKCAETTYPRKLLLEIAFPKMKNHSTSPLNSIND